MTQLPFERVTIDGFRGLRHLELHDLGPINILVGGNNSGKTSVLEALSIACNPFEPYEWLAMIRRRDFGGLDETRIQSLRWCFQQQGELADPECMFEGQCEFRTAGRFPLRRLVVEYKDMFGVPNERELKRLSRTRRGEDEIDFDEPWRGAELYHYIETDDAPGQTSLFDSSTHSTIEPMVLQLWENDPMMGRPYRPRRRGNLPTDTLTPYSYQLNKLQVRSHSSQLFGSRADPMRGKEHVLDLVREFDPAILDIEIASFRGGRPAIYLNHESLGPAPLSVFGDALRRAVLLSSTLHMLRGGLLMIDEIETGIHISALERVFRWLVVAAQHFDVQIVASTHSLEAVDGIVKAAGDLIDDVVTFHLEEENGATHAKRIPGEVLRRLRMERGLDVR